MHVIKKPHYAVYNLVKYRKKKKKSVPQFLSPNMRKKVTNYLLQSVQENIIFNCPKMQLAKPGPIYSSTTVVLLS